MVFPVQKHQLLLQGKLWDVVLLRMLLLGLGSSLWEGRGGDG
jgi:hypothetical protein